MSLFSGPKAILDNEETFSTASLALIAFIIIALAVSERISVFFHNILLPLFGPMIDQKGGGVEEYR